MLYFNIADTVIRLNSPVETGEFAASIKALRTELKSFVDVDHGLLDRLVDNDVLTDDQVKVIKTERTRSERVSHMLDDIIRISSDQVSHLFRALDDTQQNHVSNYVRANGRWTEEYGDEWPLQCNEKLIRTLAKNKTTMIEMIDCDLGLLDDMVTTRSINDQQYEAVKAGETIFKRNEQFLDILLCKSVNDFNHFIKCLVKTKQNAVAALLAPDELGKEMLPVSNEIKNRMTSRHSVLIDYLEPAYGLLDELLAAGCITQRQKEFVDLGPSKCEKSIRLLRIVRRSSQLDFDKLIECLAKDQWHVCRLLLEDGAVPEIDSDNGENQIEVEMQVVRMLMSLLKKSPNERKGDLCNDLIQWIEKFRDSDVDLIAAKQTHSISLVWLCRSKTGLFHFHDLFTSGRLKIMIEELFRLVLNDEQPGLRTNNLKWLTSNYLSCTQCFATLDSLSVDRDSREDNSCAQTHDSGFSNGVRPQQWLRLPPEVIETVLNKAAAQLFVNRNKFAPHHKSFVLTTLGKVSPQWWHLLTYRKFTKRLLKRYFENFGNPFECCPQQLDDIAVAGGCHVCGVAELKDKLYVACYGSSTLRIFNNSPPFVQLEQFEVEGLSDTYDIVICSETVRLYIADRYSQCVWQVRLLEGRKTSKFITTEFLPYSISLRCHKLLATPYDGDALYLHDENGKLCLTIQLPVHLFTRHALETDHDTFIVCHVNKFVEDTQLDNHSVSEVDTDGRIIRSFSYQHHGIKVQHFDWPRYLVLHDDGHVVVADMLGRRVVHLRPDLQMKRVLMTSLDGKPLRICLSRRTGLLFAVYYKSTNIGVHRIQIKADD